MANRYRSGMDVLVSQSFKFLIYEYDLNTVNGRQSKTSSFASHTL